MWVLYNIEEKQTGTYSISLPLHSLAQRLIRWIGANTRDMNILLTLQIFALQMKKASCSLYWQEYRSIFLMNLLQSVQFTYKSYCSMEIQNTLKRYVGNFLQVQYLYQQQQITLKANHV